jgi:hypothetical protein
VEVGIIIYNEDGESIFKSIEAAAAAAAAAVSAIAVEANTQAKAVNAVMILL